MLNRKMVLMRLQLLRDSMHPSSVYNKNDNPHFVCNIDTVDAWISTLREDDTCEMNINPDCLKIANKVWKEVKK